MIRKISLFVLYCVVHSIAFTQVFQVNAGGEMLNFGTLDLSFSQQLQWISDRAAIPGFYSVVDSGKFSGYSDEYNINGYVKKYGNTSFLFPVGNGTDLRTLEISKPFKITDAYATAWISGNPGIVKDPTPPYSGTHPTHIVTPPIQSVMRNGQWDWLVGENGNLGELTTGTGIGLTISVSMPDLTGFAPRSDLRLVGWNGNSWIDLSGKETATGNTENAMISGMITSRISAISIGKIKSTKNGKLLLYPNPLSGQSLLQLQFSTPYKGPIEISIYTSIGKKLYKYQFGSQPGINTYSINISDQPAGTYFIDIKDSNGVSLVETTSFIKL